MASSTPNITMLLYMLLYTAALLVRFSVTESGSGGTLTSSGLWHVGCLGVLTPVSEGGGKQTACIPSVKTVDQMTSNSPGFSARAD